MPTEELNPWCSNLNYGCKTNRNKLGLIIQIKTHSYTKGGESERERERAMEFGGTLIYTEPICFHNPDKLSRSKGKK